MLRKYYLRKYVNTFKGRSQTSVNKRNSSCRICYCGMRCLIPFAAAMVKKILIDRGYDESRINLFKVRWSDRLVCYFSLVYRYGINIAFNAFSCRILIIFV